MTRAPVSQFGDAVFLVFMLVQVLDGALTYLGVGLFGQGIEANPVITWLMRAVGHGPALAGAKIVAVSCGIALHLRAGHGVVAALTAVYITVAIVPWTRLLFF